MRVVLPTRNIIMETVDIVDMKDTNGNALFNGNEDLTKLETCIHEDNATVH